MKTALFAFLIVNLLDVLVMPVLSAKCRKGPMLSGENTWLPFAGLYKLFLLTELAMLALSGAVTQGNLTLVVFLVVPFLLDLMALVMAAKEGFTYTITHPITGMHDDLLRLKEHRFYPVHSFDPKFLLYGLQDNAFRYVADVVLVGTMVKILFFL